MVRDGDRRANRLNTYRVLLTRARYRTIVWVPRGDAADRTREPAEMAAVAAYLEACGMPAAAAPAPVPLPHAGGVPALL